MLLGKNSLSCFTSHLSRLVTPQNRQYNETTIKTFAYDPPILKDDQSIKCSTLSRFNTSKAEILLKELADSSTAEKTSKLVHLVSYIQNEDVPDEVQFYVLQEIQKLKDNGNLVGIDQSSVDRAIHHRNKNKQFNAGISQGDQYESSSNILLKEYYPSSRQQMLQISFPDVVNEKISFGPSQSNKDNRS